MSNEKSKNLKASRTYDLLGCITVPQQTTLPGALFSHNIRLSILTMKDMYRHFDQVALFKLLFLVSVDRMIK
jgi:hypothetical protein